MCTDGAPKRRPNTLDDPEAFDFTEIDDNPQDDDLLDYIEAFEHPVNDEDSQSEVANLNTQSLASAGSNGGVDSAAQGSNVVENAPIGIIVHRIWTCKRLSDRRIKHVPSELRHLLAQEPQAGNAALERALFPSIAHRISPRNG